MCKTYLGDPNLATAGNAANAVDPVLKVKLERVVVVPVNGNEVDVAVTALLEELLDPVETTVGHSGSTQLSMTGERLHVLVPGVDGIANLHVSLVRTVGLVKRQQVTSAAVVDPVPGVVEPLASVVVLSTPEHGDVLGKVGLLVRRAIPVVLREC